MSAPKLKYEIGDSCFISVKPGVRVMAVVVLVFTHPAHTNEFYVCQVGDARYGCFEVRDALLMSASPDVQPPMSPAFVPERSEPAAFFIN